ncbi:AraC family transcriptional regulator [Capsulimonas corticalis]|uniref:AraC family transcriptional regulator n=1 Tax=Capsulimonas corticalis TaxID=2219043 RepID=A0A402CVM7_9BACT|nr:helix-turn-helix domain-containing protein [Capsulimonas corticalis]BDI30458.1 AraC family transcriptional regulator [Capsulimonas corticalis]
MIKDRIEIDLPEYLHLLTGHYDKDPGYRSIREKGTDDWLVIATLGGSGRFGSGDDAILTRRLDVVLTRPGVAHDYGSAPGADHWELLWAHFQPRPHWYNWLIWSAGDGPMAVRLSEERWEQALACLRRSHQLASSTQTHGLDFAMNALEEMILVCHSQVMQAQPTMDERITSVLQYIHSHLTEKVSVQLLADMTALSPSRLAHLFQKQVGVAPMQYLDLQRIERSKLLLERTSSGIKHIAEEVGMDPVYFSLRFKQHTGVSPRRYRQRALTGEQHA